MTTLLHRFGTVLAFIVSLSTGLGDEPTSIPHRGLSALLPGDILVVDSGDAMVGGALFRANPQAGDSTMLATGSLLSSAYDLALVGNGQILVSAQGYLVLVHTDTGEQRVLEGLKGNPGYALGIAMDVKGNLLVANGVALVEVSLRRGRVRTVSTGGLLSLPIDVAVDRDGSLIVLDAGQPNQLVRVHPRNGTQTLITNGGYLLGASSLALVDGEIFVTCVADPSGNFGTGRIVGVEMQTGFQRLLTEGGHLCRPVGIVAAGNNSLLVADPYTPNPANDHSYDGAIIRIDLATRQQEILTRGSGSFVNPRGIAVVPETTPFRSKNGFAVETPNPFGW